MTGRELIMYILENHLEDEPVFQNGTFIGYVSDTKFAEMLGVGVATVHTWILLGRVKDAIMIHARTVATPTPSISANLASDT